MLCYLYLFKKGNSEGSLKRIDSPQLIFAIMTSYSITFTIFHHKIDFHEAIIISIMIAIDLLQAIAIPIIISMSLINVKHASSIGRIAAMNDHI